MAISITVEIPGTPDAMTHVARIIEAVISVDGRVTDLGRAPQIFDPTQQLDTGPLERAVSGEHAEVVSSGSNEGRGRRR